MSSWSWSNPSKHYNGGPTLGQRQQWLDTALGQRWGATLGHRNFVVWAYVGPTLAYCDVGPWLGQRWEISQVYQGTSWSNVGLTLGQRWPNVTFHWFLKTKTCIPIENLLMVSILNNEYKLKILFMNLPIHHCFKISSFGHRKMQEYLCDWDTCMQCTLNWCMIEK
jgi:hypothetical protein